MPTSRAMRAEHEMEQAITDLIERIRKLSDEALAVLIEGLIDDPNRTGAAFQENFLLREAARRLRQRKFPPSAA